MGEIAFMAAKEHEAFVFMRTHPADTLNFMFRRFMETWLAVTESPADIWGRAPLYLKAVFAINVLLSLLAWLGAMFVNRNRHPEAAPFVMVLLIFPLVFYLTHSTLRYRFPMEPILIVLSAYSVAYLVSLLRGRTAHVQESVTPVASLPTT